MASIYTINQSYFDSIDTEEKAYFLGLLYADGCYHKKRDIVSISLQESDKHILDSLTKSLDSNRPLGFYNYNSRNPNHKNQYRLDICGKHITSRLEELGCLQRKSLILEFPTENQVSGNLLRHFIRGFFDGDGCFTFSKPSKYKVTFTTTASFCRSLGDYIKNETGSHYSLYKKNPANNDITSTIDICGRIQAYKVLDWFYKDATVYLNRKYNKYLSKKV